MAWTGPQTEHLVDWWSFRDGNPLADNHIRPLYRTSVTTGVPRSGAVNGYSPCRGVKFSGADRIIASSISWGNATDWSITWSMWVIPLNVSSAIRNILRWESPNGNGFYHWSDNLIGYWNGTAVVGGVAAVPGRLMHLLYTQDNFGVSTEAQCWINGVATKTGETHFDTGTTARNLSFGGDLFSQYFDGIILDFRVYKHPTIMTTERIKNLWAPASRWQLFETRRNRSYQWSPPAAVAYNPSLFPYSKIERYHDLPVSVVAF